MLQGKNELFFDTLTVLNEKWQYPSNGHYIIWTKVYEILKIYQHPAVLFYIHSILGQIVDVRQQKQRQQQQQEEDAELVDNPVPVVIKGTSFIQK